MYVATLHNMGVDHTLLTIMICVSLIRYEKRYILVYCGLYLIGNSLKIH